MKYFKKVNGINEVQHLVAAEHLDNPDFVEISEEEYLYLRDKNDFDDMSAI